MQRKTVLVLGSTGMAGHLIYYHLKSTNKYNVVNVSYRTKLTEDTVIIDVKNKSQLENFILKVHPDYLINCIGILIRNSADIENAVYINSYIPHFLKNAVRFFPLMLQVFSINHFILVSVVVGLFVSLLAWRCKS